MIYSRGKPTAPRCRLFLFAKVLDKSVLHVVQYRQKEKREAKLEGGRRYV